ncbi:MAG: hypothetical protein M1828_002418 [Chrysothrix sp. TS-e1954]|nr:MAG: hypothetical protein M1828_002418 [Chrysothrix sp. TS-e1954]
MDGHHEQWDPAMSTSAMDMNLPISFDDQGPPSAFIPSNNGDPMWNFNMHNPSTICINGMPTPLATGQKGQQHLPYINPHDMLRSNTHELPQGLRTHQQGSHFESGPTAEFFRNEYQPNHQLHTQYSDQPFEGPDFPDDPLDGIHSGSMQPLSALSQKVPYRLLQHTNQFRFPVVLKAATAMTKKPEDMPVSYLNKCAPYTVVIQDSIRPLPTSMRYRTSLRISFDDEQQRDKPAAAWQLWKEGRGQRESMDRGTDLFAMEYVRNDQAQMQEVHSDVDIVNERFDGFSFEWSPSMNGDPKCSIPVRFNFLSTDFSHSKGVKGVPLRLCCKTEPIQQETNTASVKEISYCHVKLFRDHGAERKIANDKTHIQKALDKLHQQEASNPKDSKKRRRSSGTTGQRPSKKMRGDSVSSGSSFGVQDPGEDEYTTKVRRLESMNRSIQIESWFLSKGDDSDDLDAHPIYLSGTKKEDEDDSLLMAPKLGYRSTSQSISRTSDISQSASPMLHRGSDAMLQDARPSASISRSSTWNEESQRPSTFNAEVRYSNPQHLASPPNGSTKIRKVVKNGEQAQPEWIEALDVDRTYRARTEPRILPAACFYIKSSMFNGSASDSLYRAVYLSERTLSNLVETICTKLDVESTTISETSRVNNAGLAIKLDDEVVDQIPDEQDMVVEFESDATVSHASDAFFHDHDHAAEMAPTYRLTIRY